MLGNNEVLKTLTFVDAHADAKDSEGCSDRAKNGT